MNAVRGKQRWRLLPRLMTERERDVWLCTLAWAGHPFGDAVEWFVELAPGLSTQARVPDIFDPKIADYLKNTRFRFDVENAGGASVLAWRHDAAVPLGSRPATVVDPNHAMHHTFALQKALLSAGGVSVSASVDALLELKQRARSRAYLFGSGPSLGLLEERFDPATSADSYRLICNGVVLNRRATDCIVPDVACALDPLYHAGVSFYSGRFVDEMRRLMEVHGTLLLTRREFVPWLSTRLPEDRIVGLDIVDDVSFRWELDSKPVLGNLNGNVLVAGMLPVGAFLADELILLGFDGRNPNLSPRSEGNRFAWSHDEQSSIRGWEDRIAQVNPKVFDRDYDAYHQRHDRTLSLVLRALQDADKRVHRLNEPFISALAELPRWTAQNASGPR